MNDVLDVEIEDERSEQVLGIDNQITLNNIEFSYGYQEPVFNDLNINFQKNIKYGIIGKSGSGKSTLLKLIAILEKPQKGDILFGNVDTKNVNEYILRKNIGYTSQKEMNDLSNIENISNATVDFTPNGNLLLVTPTQIYLIDKETGRIKQEYLDGKSMINAYDCIEEGICIICNGQLICLDYDSGRKISPSGIKEIAENIKKLDITGNSNLKFLKKDGRISALCYLDAYATDAPGLVEVTSRGYRGLVDGSRTYYGHYDYLLSILEADDKGNIYSVFWGEPEKIMQYTYEKNNEKATKQLKIYSLRDSRVIRQNMLIYQQKNPDIDIIYEIGIGNNAERTEQDAIKNLNTEIAAGTGPDIIVLDGLRMEEYIKQGAEDVIKGKSTSEETAENVEKKLKLYLLE